MHGDDWKEGIQAKTRQAVIDTITSWGGELIEVPYTQGISSSSLNSAIKELVLTDTIEPTNEVKNTKNIRHISIAPLMGEAINRISSDASVSALFD